MKKIIIALVIGCFTVHCQPPPKKPTKNHYLRLENLIYAVALSSLKVAHQMDVKRKDNILKQVREQQEREREKDAVALKALEERIRGLIEERGVSNRDAPENPGALTVQESHPSESPSEPASLEKKLAQLESLVFGEEGSDGLLYRVTFLKEKWALSSDPSLASSGSELAASGGVSPEAAEITLLPEAGADNEERLKSLALLLQGEGDFPGALFQTEELEEALSFINLTEDQVNALTEQVTVFVEEQKGQVSAETSVEDRLNRLENLIYGTDESEGIISQIGYLQTQTATLKTVPPASAPHSDSIDDGS